MLALRLDDVGASSKKYEVYSNWRFGRGRLAVSGNWLWLKYIRPFKRWGPYREMTAIEWENIYSLLEKHNAKLTVAITAAWVTDEHSLTPFPQRFPEEASVLKDGLSAGHLEIANHGLTHCVIENNSFKPKLFSSNRIFHREFWEWIPENVQLDHMQRSQDILQNWFETDIVTFVPPGNVFCDATVRIAEKCGLRYLSCNTASRIDGDMTIMGNENTFAFHDRDIVLRGVSWFRDYLESAADSDLITTSEMAASTKVRLST